MGEAEMYLRRSDDGTPIEPFLGRFPSKAALSEVVRSGGGSGTNSLCILILW